MCFAIPSVAVWSMRRASIGMGLRKQACGGLKAFPISDKSTRELSTYISSFPSFTTVEKHPVKNAIFWLAQGLQNLGEKFPQEVIIWCFLETKLPDVVHVNCEFLWKEDISKYTLGDPHSRQ